MWFSFSVLRSIVIEFYFETFAQKDTRIKKAKIRLIFAFIS